MPRRYYLGPSTTTADVASAFAELSDKGPIGLDIETTGLEPTQGDVRLVQVSDGSATLVLHHKLRDAFVPRLRGLLDGSRLIVGQNLAFEGKWLLHHYGLRLRRVFDTKYAHKALTCGKPVFERNSLGDLTWYWLGRQREEKKEMQLSFTTMGPDDEPTPEQVEYAAFDAEDVLLLMDEMMPRILELGLKEALRIRFSMIPVVAEMELYGAPINRDSYALDIEMATRLRAVVETTVVEQLTPPVLEWRVQKHDEKFAVWQAWKHEYGRAKEANALAADALPEWTFDSKSARRSWINEQNRNWKEEHKAPPKPRLDSGPINLNSPQQVLAALNALGYPFKSTRSDEFEEYADLMEEQGADDPLIEPFLTWKKLRKIEVAFNYLDKIDCVGEACVIRPSVNLMVTTGRMSMSKPNLQQVPKPVKVDAGLLGERLAEFADLLPEGAEKRFIIDLRRHFEAPPGYLIGRLDFSNVEMRIAADQSGDPQLVQDFLNGDDFHTRVAAMYAGIPYEEAKRLKAAGDERFNDLRDEVKPKNFGTIYGLWDEEHIQFFSATYPRLWEWLQQQGYAALRSKQSRAADGFLKWWLLDREPPKYINKVQNEDWIEWRRKRNRIMRQAKNFPIQATSAAMTQAAAVEWHAFLTALAPDHEWGGNRVWNLVHDEGDFLMKELRHVEFMLEMKAIAERVGNRFMRQVPIVADINIGRYWAK